MDAIVGVRTGTVVGSDALMKLPAEWDRELMHIRGQRERLAEVVADLEGLRDRLGPILRSLPETTDEIADTPSKCAPSSAIAMGIASEEAALKGLIDKCLSELLYINQRLDM